MKSRVKILAVALLALSLLQPAYSDQTEQGAMLVMLGYGALAGVVVGLHKIAKHYCTRLKNKSGDGIEPSLKYYAATMYRNMITGAFTGMVLGLAALANSSGYNRGGEHDPLNSRAQVALSGIVAGSVGAWILGYNPDNLTWSNYINSVYLKLKKFIGK